LRVSSVVPSSGGASEGAFLVPFLRVFLVDPVLGFSKSAFALFQENIMSEEEMITSVLALMFFVLAVVFLYGVLLLGHPWPMFWVGAGCIGLGVVCVTTGLE
jgi:hypothetical protein